MKRLIPFAVVIAAAALTGLAGCHPEGSKDQGSAGVPARGEGGWYDGHVKLPAAADTPPSAEPTPFDAAKAAAAPTLPPATVAPGPSTPTAAAPAAAAPAGAAPAAAAAPAGAAPAAAAAAPPAAKPATPAPAATP